MDVDATCHTEVSNPVVLSAKTGLQDVASSGKEELRLLLQHADVELSPGPDSLLGKSSRGGMVYMGQLQR